MSLDLTAGAVALTEQLVDIESVSQQRAGDRRRDRGGAAPACQHLSVTRRGNTWWRAPTSAAASGWSSPATSTPCRSTTTCPRRNDGDQPARPRHLRHEGRRRGRAAARGDGARAQPRPHLHLLRVRGDRRRSSTACGCSPTSDPELMAGRLRDPDGALATPSSRPAARAPCASRSAPAASARTAPAAGRASTPSTGAAEVLDRLNAYDARRPVIDGLEYHEGLNAVFDQRRRGRQRPARRVRGHGQLPVRPRPLRGGGRRLRPRPSSRGTT